MITVYNRYDYRNTYRNIQPQMSAGSHPFAAIFLFKNFLKKLLTNENNVL